MNAYLKEWYDAFQGMVYDTMITHPKHVKNLEWIHWYNIFTKFCRVYYSYLKGMMPSRAWCMVGGWLRANPRDSKEWCVFRICKLSSSAPVTSPSNSSSPIQIFSIDLFSENIFFYLLTFFSSLRGDGTSFNYWKLLVS